MSFHSLKASGSSLKNIQYGIDAVANNIANINTTGFRKQQPSFESVVSGKGRDLGEGLSGTALNALTTVFSQGGMKSTGLYSDLAIQGEGFFSLQNSAGDIVYSRAGHFLQDSNGNLVDPAGNYVMSVNGDRVAIPVDASEVEITPLGEIFVGYGDVEGPQYFDQIQLVSFANPAGLMNIGSNNFKESLASGTPNFGTAGQAGTKTQQSVIVSGALELSNTNLSEGMTDMIAYQRSYQAVSRTSTTADEVLQTTINLAS